jgi:phosphatidylinositol-3-phosphatase
MLIGCCMIAANPTGPTSSTAAAASTSTPTAPATTTPAKLPRALYLPVVLNHRPPLPTPTTTPQVTPPGRLPNFKHVFVIVMENEALEQIIGNTGSAPYINSLADTYGVAANYYGVTHPSLPNYIAMISGDTQSIATNCADCFVDAPNLVDQLEAAGKTWKGYMESMPSPCFAGDSGTLYRQKHNPFMYFDNIRTNPARCANLVPFEQFTVDLQANKLPDFIWITPNMCNNIHDCPLATGDDWLRTWISKIVASPAWQQDGVLFLTFDESERADVSGCCQYAAGGHILTLVVSPLARPAYRSPVDYSHYSLLRTIEQAWGLPFLNKAGCDCSQPMTDFFIHH